VVRNAEKETQWVAPPTYDDDLESSALFETIILILKLYRTPDDLSYSINSLMSKDYKLFCE
jgi:hypothetical protein